MHWVSLYILCSMSNMWLFHTLSQCHCLDPEAWLNDVGAMRLCVASSGELLPDSAFDKIFTIKATPCTVSEWLNCSHISRH